MFLPERIDVTTGYQLGANCFVQFAALVVCRTDDENALARRVGGNVFARYLVRGFAPTTRAVRLVDHEKARGIPSGPGA
jgi:hypothetical protein